MTRRHEKPLRRVNPSGRIVWVARWTGRDGRRRNGWPPQIPGTYELKRDAQAAIDACYDRDSSSLAPRQVGTVDAYVEHWKRLHPRSRSTARTYGYNLQAALDVKVGRRPLREWRMDEVERSELAELLHHLLVVDGRAVNGARSVLATLSSMWEDAISDGWARHNPVAGLRVRRSDPRVRKPPRVVRTYSWEQMHAISAVADPVQGSAMIRCLSDLGLRLGEMLGLERGDIDDGWLWVRRTAQDGVLVPGTKTTRDAPENARRTPLPPLLSETLRSLPPRLDTRLLFPTAAGGPWMNKVFYAELWRPACKAAGLEGALPHELRHSYVSLMRAAGVDPAHLAAWTGHTVLTATAVYTHPVGDVSDMARRAVG